MSDSILWVSIAILLLAVVSAILLPLWLGRKSSPGNLGELLRTEGDQTRRTVAEEMRNQRQELATSLRDFRTELLTELAQFREAVGAKLDSELKRLGDEATANRDKLRETISSRLDEQSAAQAKAGRELREEVTGSVQKLQEGVLQVAADQRIAQETQFEGFGRRLTLASDTLNTAMTALTEALAKAGIDLREEVTNIFQALGDTLSKTINQMSEHQKERLATVDQTMLQLSQKHHEAGEMLKATVEERLAALQQSNAAKLDEIRKTVDEQLQQTLQDRLTSSFKLVSDQLEQVYRGLGEMQKLADGVGDLKRVLANVKTRGIYGEVQLAALMEQVFSPTQYLLNAQVKKSTQERVEFALRLPGRESEEDVLLPIDSKFPIEDYDRLQEASMRGDVDAVAAASGLLDQRIRSFAKEIGDKYVNPPMTTDIAILFLPTEGLYAEVIRRPGLVESMMEKHRVTIAGPTTLLAMLSAFRMALRAVAVQKRSAEVWNVLSAVKTEFGKYGNVVTKLHAQLETSLKTVGDLETRTKVMNRRLGAVEGVEMTTEDAQKLLGVAAGEPV